jgi:hypothetical protein
MENIEEQEDQSLYDWSRQRKMNYSQFGEEDIGHIYDMLQCVADQLSVQFKPDDKSILDHRKAIKLAYPKDNTNV